MGGSFFTNSPFLPPHLAYPPASFPSVVGVGQVWSGRGKGARRVRDGYRMRVGGVGVGFDFLQSPHQKSTTCFTSCTTSMRSGLKSEEGALSIRWRRMLVISSAMPYDVTSVLTIQEIY